MSPPLILSVAGFDPSGRAGLLADLRAIGDSGGSPLGVVTALTAQGARFVCAPVAHGLVRHQLDAALARGKVKAIKLGMVPNRKTLAQIVLALRERPVPIVVDPVVRTSRGEPLSSLTARDYLQLGRKLRCVVLTPNRAELAWLGKSAFELLELGYSAVVVKGSETGLDEIFSPDGSQLLSGSRLRRTSNHRGTGCRFGSGLATHLGRGEDLLTAARKAKRLVREFLVAL